MVKKQYYKINRDGYLIEIIAAEVNPGGLISVDPPNGLYKPKWVGDKWVNGLTQQEIDELNKPIVPETSTENYLIDLDFRISMIELGGM